MVSALKREGIEVIILTGDNPRTAKAVAMAVGAGEVYAEMLPEDKLAKIKALKEAGKRVAMVGDGINDAPALAEASVGIALGAIGTDVAIEASDVALMNDDLTKIPAAIEVGRSTFNTIKQNIGASVAFNIVGVSLASLGLLSPVAAAFAHALPDIIVLINSLRLILD